MALVEDYFRIKVRNEAYNDIGVIHMFIASKRYKIVCKQDCGLGKRIMEKNLISYNTVEEALKDGCRKCKRCFKGGN